MESQGRELQAWSSKAPGSGSQLRETGMAGPQTEPELTAPTEYVRDKQWESSQEEPRTHLGVLRPGGPKAQQVEALFHSYSHSELLLSLHV